MDVFRDSGAPTRRAFLIGGAAAVLTSCASPGAPDVARPDSGSPDGATSRAPLFSRSKSDKQWQAQFDNWKQLHGDAQEVVFPNNTGGLFVANDGSLFAWGIAGLQLSSPTCPWRGELLGTSDPNAVNATRNGDSRLQCLARAPQAAWLGTWTNTNGSDVADVFHRADVEGTRPLFVLYALRQMNDVARYKTWARETVRSLTKNGVRKPVVIVEPDEIAFIASGNEYPNNDERLDAIREVVEQLSAANVPVLIDAGHDNWASPQTTAHALLRAGVQHATGFSVNVSNFRVATNNDAFGRAIVSELEKLGAPGKVFVDDCGRNGAALPDAATPFNPIGMRLGESPTPFASAVGSAGHVVVKNYFQSDSSEVHDNSIACPSEGAVCLPLANELLRPAAGVTPPTVSLVNGRDVSIAWPDGRSRTFVRTIDGTERAPAATPTSGLSLGG